MAALRKISLIDTDSIDPNPTTDFRVAKVSQESGCIAGNGYLMLTEMQDLAATWTAPDVGESLVWFGRIPEFVLLEDAR